MTVKMYTIGDISRICCVAPRIASQWIDKGLLKGHRIPGSRDRRVTHKDLVVFAKRHSLDDVLESIGED